MELDSVIHRAAGVTGGSPLAAVLSERAEILELSERSYQAVLSPDDLGGLPPGLRAALACRIALINEDGALAGHYRALVAAAAADARQLARICDPQGAPAAGDDLWLAAVVAHADRLTTAPQSATRAEIDALQHCGVADADIVRLTQLVGFVNYQLRLVAGLRLLSGQVGGDER